MNLARLPSLIASLALLPAFLAISGCSPTTAEAPPEISDAALDAVTKEPGAPREALARAADALFTRDDAGETRALLVMHEGKVVLERYGPGYSSDTRFVGWSMSKSVTAVMIGMLVADGRLRLDDSPPIPRWQRSGDTRGEITLRQLLQMRSGLRHTEMGEPIYDSDTVRMLFTDGRNDMARYAQTQPLEAEPGQKFEYSTPTSVILSDIAARALTEAANPEVRRTVVSDFMESRIFTPLGMKSMVAEYDQAGTMLGGSLIHANARDWARFGEFLRNGGSVKGAQLVPRGWVDFMKTPSPMAPDYGAHLWLNRPSGGARDVLFADRGPADMVAAVGHLGQYVLVSPSRKITVVRLGKTDNADRGAVMDALSELVALYPAD